MKATDTTALSIELHGGSIYLITPTGNRLVEIRPVSAEGGLRLNEIVTQAAAAPDLLTALKDLAEYWRNGTPIQPGAWVTLDAETAITKATP